MTMNCVRNACTGDPMTYILYGKNLESGDFDGFCFAMHNYLLSFFFSYFFFILFRFFVVVVILCGCLCLPFYSALGGIEFKWSVRNSELKLSGNTFDSAECTTKCWSTFIVQNIGRALINLCKRRCMLNYCWIVECRVAGNWFIVLWNIFGAGYRCHGI